METAKRILHWSLGVRFTIVAAVIVTYLSVVFVFGRSDSYMQVGWSGGVSILGVPIDNPVAYGIAIAVIFFISVGRMFGERTGNTGIEIILAGGNRAMVYETAHESMSYFMLVLMVLYFSKQVDFALATVAGSVVGALIAARVGYVAPTKAKSGFRRFA